MSNDYDELDEISESDIALIRKRLSEIRNGKTITWEELLSETGFSDEALEEIKP